MRRSLSAEILDDRGVPDHVLEAAHKDLTRTHRWLGNTAALVRALSIPGPPVRRVLDVGCGHGGVLADIRDALGIEPVGVDLRPPPAATAPFVIVEADAVHDPLPGADVAISVAMAHHLDEHDLAALIRNVARSCPRLILLDLVRHPLPLWLFRLFVAPALPAVNAADGCQSVRRAYTPDELRRIVEHALKGAAGTFRHTVAPFYTRQIVDICFA